jgi:hypothetical protein
VVGTLALSVAVISAGCGKSSSVAREEPSEGGAGGATDGGAAGVAEPSAGVPSAGEAGQGDAGTPPVLLPELSLTRISVSQTLEIGLMENGAEVPAARRQLPLIAEKRAFLRAFVSLGERYVARPLLGVLDLQIGKRSHSVVSERTLTQSSLAEDLSTSFNFDVPAEDLIDGASYRVRVLEADTEPLLRFPEEGFAGFVPQSLPTFKLVLVPYRSNGFEPRTDVEDLERLRRRLVALYPSRDVEISVAPAVELEYAVDADGGGWDDALDLIYELRDKAAPAPAADVFYYGLLAPAASEDAYCPKGCILGYALIASEQDAGERAAIGVGIFQDGSGAGDAEDTTAHELGHALGRDHAPCGIPDPNDVDPSWPEDALHKNALIGGYGYDFELSRLVKPKPTKDVMSYCTPSWVSDYTYAGLFERLQAIATQGGSAQSVQRPQAVRVARIRRSGDSRWLGARTKVGLVAGTHVELLDTQGGVVARIPARFAPVDHGPGGYVWLPEKPLAAAHAVSVDLRPFGGSVLPL